MIRPFLFSLFFSATTVFSQVGINTDQPSSFSSLDIKSENTGILIPRVSLKTTKDLQTVKFNDNSLTPNENSLLVYNTNTTSLPNGVAREDEVEHVFPGFYYWENDRWVRMASKTDKQFFYMPSIVIPTHSSQLQSGQTLGTIDLYTIYSSQFGAGAVSNPGATAKLPIYKNNQLDYFVTWYDPKIFRNVRVSNSGVLTYELLTTTDVVLGSFMNIVFAVK